MDEIRLFLKRVAKDTYNLSIAHKKYYKLYKYKFDKFILLFKEIDGEVVSLVYDDKTYTDFIEIQLLLFNLFDYKNMEYIDVYLQSIKDIYIEDIYDDYYDSYDRRQLVKRIFVLSKLSKQEMFTS